MSKPLRFQVLTLPNTTWPEALERFKLVETLGFDVVATADHLVDWTNPPSPWLEAWTLLAAVARETTTIRLTTCVSQIPLRNPAMFARQALTLDHISNGRVDVGLGIGLEIDPSYDMAGLPNWTPKERVARFKEYVELVDQLLSNEVTTYEGRFYRAQGTYMNPRPVQQPRPPILVAAMGPVMLKRAAHYADIWNSLSFAETFDEQMQETRTRVDQLDEHCAAIGRDPDSIMRSYQMFDPGARKSGGLFNYYESPDLFVEMVGHILEMGITELGLYYPMMESQVPAFEKLAREVIPEIRKQHAEA